MNIDRASIRKILVLRYRSIGDIILSFPTFEALKTTFPRARVDMVVDDALTDICYAHPYVDYIIMHERKKWDKKHKSSLGRELSFIMKIRKQKYDMVVDLHCGPRSSLLTLLSGARYRLGNNARIRNKFTYNLKSRTKPRSPHSVDVMMNIISPLRPKMPGRKSLFLHFRDNDRSYVKKFLERYDISEKDTVVLVHPGARLDYKRLPAQKMGEVVKWMTTELGVKVIYAGSDRDLSMIADIVSYSGGPGLMATNLSLGQLAALIKSCGLFLGNDSGPMHMAAALSVPIVAFFGPSDPEVWSPWGAHGKIVRPSKMHCMPCSQKGCPYVGDHCMARIKVGDIKRAISDTLKIKTLASG
ncbi:MAG: putative lipopolysaccharide heptosyltransferase III [bacterium]|nr:MAG: putative lipopolysaccharide heptosyltransferase III [bacterium]